MHINQIHLKNFRCYEDVEIEFHPRFNIFVGINGTGMSSALEALRIAIGSLFLGVDKYKDKIASPGISQDDVRLSRLEQQYPDRAFYFIMGADNWQNVTRWYEAEQLLAGFPILIYPRKGFRVEIPTRYPHVRLVDAPLIEISSSFIRDALAAGKDVRFFLPEGVREMFVKERKQTKAVCGETDVKSM